jgi:SNF2 family DNA or RNA helicase
MGLGKTAQAIALLMHLQTSRVGCTKLASPKIVLRIKGSAPAGAANPAPRTSPLRPTPALASLGHRRGPFLVIAPLSTLGHWTRELATWTIGAGAAVRQSLCRLGDEPRSASGEADLLCRFPGHVLASLPMNTLLYHGSAPARAILREFEWFFEDASTGVQLRSPLPMPPDVVVQRVEDAQRTLLDSPKAARWLPCYKFDVLLTTYETVMQDSTFLGTVPWTAIIVDEAHRLKNGNSKLYLELRKWPRDFSVLLTGTPLQNTVEVQYASVKSPRCWSCAHVSSVTCRSCGLFCISYLRGCL